MTAKPCPVDKADVIADALAAYADAQGWSKYDSVVLAVAYVKQRAELAALRETAAAARSVHECAGEGGGTVPVCAVCYRKLGHSIARARAAQGGGK